TGPSTHWNPSPSTSIVASTSRRASSAGSRRSIDGASANATATVDRRASGMSFMIFFKFHHAGVGGNPKVHFRSSCKQLAAERAALSVTAAGGAVFAAVEDDLEVEPVPGSHGEEFLQV